MGKLTAKNFDYSQLEPKVAEKLKAIEAKIRELYGSGPRRGPRLGSKRPRGDGWIYFAQQGEGGPIKIGFTKDLLKRLSSLQVGSPCKLILRCTIRAFKEQERELQARFRRSRLSGEWFSPTEDLIEFMEEIGR